MDLLKKIIDLSDVYDEPSAMAQGGRIGFEKAGPVKSKFYAPKAAETKKLKATKKLKDFVEKFKLDNNGQLPTQQQIMKAVGGKSETIQKYLTEGVDYAKRTTKQEAGRLAGLRSGEVRAVPEGQDPSYVKRAKKIKESEKFQSKQDKADLEQIKKGKKEINKYFKNKPDAINNTEFGKNIKAMMAMRMDKDGKFYSRVMSDDYYKKKASEGKIYDLFDIKPVAEGGKNLRYPVNVNITPGQFNSAFIQAQVAKAFSKGIKPESVKFLDNYLKEKNIRVKLPNVGYVGADETVAVTGKPGQRTFPKITKTLESMQAPEEILKFFKIPKSEAGFIQRELLEGVGRGVGKGIRIAGKYFGIPDAIFYYIDKQNMLSKGMPEKEAQELALKNASFGAYKSNNEYMKGLKKTAESMGIDARTFDNIYKLNVAGQKFDKYFVKAKEEIEDLKELGYYKKADDAQKNLDRYMKEQNENLGNLSQKVIDQVSISKAGGVASPLQLSKARDVITQEDFYKPFKDITKAATEKLKREKIKAAPTQKLQVDTTAGTMGEGFYKVLDSLTQGAKNLLQGRVIPFASKIGFPQYEPRASQRKILSDTLQNLSARDLERFNLGRGYVQSDPVSKLDLQNLQFQQPGVFFSKGGRASHMGGGIAGIRRPNAIPPERQGLRSIMIGDMND